MPRLGRSKVLTAVSRGLRIDGCMFRAVRPDRNRRSSIGHQELRAADGLCNLRLRDLLRGCNSHTRMNSLPLFIPTKPLKVALTLSQDFSLRMLPSQRWMFG